MPRHPLATEDLYENDFSYETEDGFHPFLQSQARKAPWWMMSIGMHAILIALCLLIPWDAPPKTVVQEFTATLMPEEKETEEEPEDDWEEEKDLNPEEAPHETPVEKEDAILDEINESENNEESQQNMGVNELAVSENLNFEATHTNIGMGGGAAGNYGTRTGGKTNRVTRLGGKGTQSAVDAGLAWLKAHQHPDGYWDSDGYFARCGHDHERTGRCSGVGGGSNDPGNTGLALLAFLGAGHTHHTKGKYQMTVKRGLKYLKTIQDTDGCFGPRRGHHFMYNHTIAALAMAEAYGLTQSPTLRASAQRGVDFLAKAQNPGLAWRYDVQVGDNDSSVTGWVVMVLKSAKIAGLEVPQRCFEGARKWFDSVTDEQYYRTGYLTKGDRGARLKSQEGKFSTSESMTAVAVMSRVFMGAEKTDPRLRGGASILLDSLPEWSTDGGPGGTSKIDFYYWYYGTLAMFQMGGDYWKRWNENMKSALVDHQQMEKGTCLRGSWDPVGAWGGSGGRVYATAINVLSLEIYYRYERVFR